MGRIKSRAGVFLGRGYNQCDSSPSSSESIEHIELNIGVMARRKNQDPDSAPLDKIYIHNMGPGHTLLTGAGDWSDRDAYFVVKDPQLDDSIYFEDMSHAHEGNNAVGVLNT